MDKNINQPTPAPTEIKKEVEQERKINKKLLGIVLLLLLIVISGGAYLFSQNKSIPEVAVAPTVTPTTNPADSTANWKTYKNTDEGFSIDYPSNWFFRVDRSETSDGVKETGFISNKNTKTLADSLLPDVIAIDTHVITPSKVFNRSFSEDDFYNPMSWYWNKDDSGYYEAYTVNFVELKNNRAMVNILRPIENYESLSVDQRIYSYNFWHNGNVVVVNFTLNQKNPELDQATRTKEQILSTFRFD